MRIHSNTVNEADIRRVVDVLVGGNVRVHSLTRHGSRSRHHALNLILSGSSKFGGQYGDLNYAAATWDEWGIVLNAIFELDPDAVVLGVYESAEHFHWVTGDRYRMLTPGAQHLRHNWLSGDAGGRSVGGSYYVQSCKCGAIVRRLAHGRTFSADIAHEFDGVV